VITKGFIVSAVLPSIQASNFGDRAMNRLIASCSFVILAAGWSVNANAALVSGVIKPITASDVGVQQGDYLLFNRNGAGTGIGTLSLVTALDLLTSAAGKSTPSQNYGGAYPTELTLNINDATGAFVGGSISIGAGTTAGAPAFSWTGTMTNGGMTTANTGSLANGLWKVTADTYKNMPANMAQFVNGYLTKGSGGFTISSTGLTLPPSTTTNWVLGASPPPAAVTGLALYTALGTHSTYTGTVQTDIYASPVPLPPAAWGMLGGLGLLLMSARRRAPTEMI
jgi:hypothetical protein